MHSGESALVAGRGRRNAKAVPLCVRAALNVLCRHSGLAKHRACLLESWGPEDTSIVRAGCAVAMAIATCKALKFAHFVCCKAAVHSELQPWEQPRAAAEPSHRYTVARLPTECTRTKALGRCSDCKFLGTVGSEGTQRVHRCACERGSRCEHGASRGRCCPVTRARNRVNLSSLLCLACLLRA